MDYIKSTFEKMNIQDIIHFLIYDGTYIGTSKGGRSYKDRLNDESNPIYNRLQEIYSEGDELDEALAELSQAIDSYTEVYMEIGMKAGMKLFIQLLSDNNVNF